MLSISLCHCCSHPVLHSSTTNQTLPETYESEWKTCNESDNRDELHFYLVSFIRPPQITSTRVVFKCDGSGRWHSSTRNFIVMIIPQPRRAAIQSSKLTILKFPACVLHPRSVSGWSISGRFNASLAGCLIVTNSGCKSNWSKFVLTEITLFVHKHEYVSRAILIIIILGFPFSA